MSKLVLEVGMKLDGHLVDYHTQLLNHGFNLEFSCTTHDVYFTKEKSLDNLAENQMKNACIRIRNGNENQERELINQGYRKVFDTIKMDFHYNNGKIKSRVQLQDIKDIGLLVYYDNPDYYEYDEDKQKTMLLNELNSYGFNFKQTDLGLDKLRTLYYGKEMFSKNQNG